MNRGQGLVEYALVLTLLAIVVIAVFEFLPAMVGVEWTIAMVAVCLLYLILYFSGAFKTIWRQDGAENKEEAVREEEQPEDQG